MQDTQNPVQVDPNASVVNPTATTVPTQVVTEQPAGTPGPAPVAMPTEPVVTTPSQAEEKVELPEVPEQPAGTTPAPTETPAA